MSQLTDRIASLNSEIEQARAQASEQWTRFERVRDELAGSDDASNPESSAFQNAEATHREYAQTAENLANLEHTRQRLYAMASADGQSPPEPPSEPGSDPRNELPSVADRVLQSEAYADLRASGALRDGSRARVGDRVLAQGLSRDELRSQLRGGAIQNALVTGADDAQAGAFVTPDRKGYVPMRFRPLRLVDLVTIGETDSDTVEYVEQTGFTNNAAETAEATATAGTSGTKPESGMAFVVRQAFVRTIAHWVPATKRALADAGQLRTIIDGLLRLGLDLRLDTQMASGDGLGENLRGIYNTTGIGSIARVVPATGNTNTPESRADAIHRALTIIRLAFHEPSATGLHPRDWQDLRLLRGGNPAVANTATVAGSEATGDYLLGKPQEASAEQIWGVPVVQGVQFTEGSGLVGDYAQAVLWLREGTQVLASDSHADFFVRNLVAVLAEMRAAFGIVAPPAFCVVTGL